MPTTPALKTAKKTPKKTTPNTAFKTPTYLARALDAAGGLTVADPDAARALDAFARVALRNALRNAAAVMAVCGGKTVTAKHFQVLAEIQRHPVRMGAAAARGAGRQQRGGMTGRQAGGMTGRQAGGMTGRQAGGMLGATVLPSEYFGKASGRYGGMAEQAGGHSSSSCGMTAATGLLPAPQAGGMTGRQVGGMLGATVLPSEYFGKASGRYAAQAGGCGGGYGSGSSGIGVTRPALPLRGFPALVGGSHHAAAIDMPKAFVDAEIKAFLASGRDGPAASFKVAKDAKAVLGAVAAHNLARALADARKAARGATALTAGAVRRVLSSRAYRRYAVEV
jgi:hypothetical protein